MHTHIPDPDTQVDGLPERHANRHRRIEKRERNSVRTLRKRLGSRLHDLNAPESLLEAAVRVAGRAKKRASAYHALAIATRYAASRVARLAPGTGA